MQSIFFHLKVQGTVLLSIVGCSNRSSKSHRTYSKSQLPVELKGAAKHGAIIQHVAVVKDGYCINRAHASRSSVV